MGNCGSTQKAPAAAQPTKIDDKPKQQLAFAKHERKINPQDLMIENQKEQIIMRRDGQIAGEHVDIADSTDCDIFICDYTDSVNIDNLQNCRVFIGPTSGSIFIRDCKGCNFVVCCGQLRLRGCENMSIGLFVNTDPIIESSQQIKIGCLDFFYFSMTKHLEEAGLKPWNNKWWRVYDFSHTSGKSPNWEMLPQEESLNLLDVKKGGMHKDMSEGFKRLIPVTLGNRPKPVGCDANNALVIFFADCDSLIDIFLDAAQEQNVQIVRGKTMHADCAQRKEMFSFDKALAKAHSNKKTPALEFTLVELCGKEVDKEINGIMSTRVNQLNKEKVVVVPESHSQNLAQNWFQNWEVKM